MKHLAIFYTNNSTTSLLLRKVVGHFIEMVCYDKFKFSTKGIIVSVSPIAFEGIENFEGVKNITVPKEIISNGHLSIIEKIILAMKEFPSDYISLHEHDVLYPREYLEIVQDVIYDVGTAFDYLAYNNIIGVNETGYQQRTVQDYPLSTLTFSNKALQNLLEHKRAEYNANKGWCYLEPGYGGSYGDHFKKIEIGKGAEKPVVHINMNNTESNHHLTNHYLTYEPVSKTGFNEWPGDLSYFFV